MLVRDVADVEFNVSGSSLRSLAETMLAITNSAVCLAATARTSTRESAQG
jgi:hypothetical protein